MNEIILQIISNVIILILSFVIVAFFQKGFFWQYARVKLSFGSLVLVKVKEINRDLYRVGKIVENDLLYKLEKDNRRLTLDKSKPQIYRSIGVNMIDVDAEKNTILNPTDYSSQTGYDADKMENLYVRALTKPQITDNQERLILILSGLAVIMIGILIYMQTKQGEEIVLIKNTVASLNKGLITASSGL